MKKCTKCKSFRELTDFSKQSSRKDGYRNQCKSCDKKARFIYYKSKPGLFTGIYGQQKASSKRRGHPMQDYSKKELTEWMKLQPNFEKLWDDWVESGYNKMYVPSCDRLDDSKPYTLDNLQLVTWKVNKANGHESARNGSISMGKPYTPVIGINKVNGVKVEYHSMSEAARQLNINKANICAACAERIPSAGGYKWKYKKI